MGHPPPGSTLFRKNSNFGVNFFYLARSHSSSSGHSQQNSEAHGNRECEDGPAFSPSCNSLECVVTNSGANSDRVVSKISHPVDRSTLATAKMICYFVQDRCNRVADLIRSFRASS